MHCSRSRPRGVLKYRLKIRVSIYLFLSVGRKMTPFPETVSDPQALPLEGYCEKCARAAALVLSPIASFVTHSLRLIFVISEFCYVPFS